MAYSQMGTIPRGGAKDAERGRIIMWEYRGIWRVYWGKYRNIGKCKDSGGYYLTHTGSCITL